MKTFYALAALFIFGVLLSACNTQTQHRAAEYAPGGDSHHGITTLSNSAAVKRFFARGARIDAEETFRQVGLMITADKAPALRYRVQGVDGSWTNWAKAELTWSEAPLHNARILLDSEATALELRGARSSNALMIELFAEALGSVGPLARDLPLAEASLDPQFGPSWVVTRSAWGARNPGKVCGSSHRPNKVTIHHTAGSNGEANPAAVMRSIQAYHIDNNGWCDVGYHFVVSADGTVFQGRDERRTGAHTGGQNTNNAGIALMGNFEIAGVPEAQLNSAAKITGWVGRTFSISLSRSSVKGHGERKSTACPGRNLLVKLPTLVARANGPATGDYGPFPSVEHFVDRQYWDFFGRKYDQDGFDYWLGQIKAGTAPEALLDAFAKSAEAKREHIRGSNTDRELELIYIIYRAMLGYDPDAASLRYWQGQITALDTAPLTSFILQSSDYRNRVR